MKFARYIYGLLGFAFCWAACSKGDIPPDVVEDPVFMVAYQDTGGDTASLTAGIDSVYLFTNHSTTNQQIVCTGAFADAGCPDSDCPGSLRFEFSTPFTDAFDADSVFHNGSFNYVNLDSGSTDFVYRGTFQVDNTFGFNDFSWRIDDVDVGSGEILEYDFPDISVTPFVELTSLRSSGLRSIITRKVSALGSNLPVELSLRIELDTAAFYKVVAEINPPSFDSLLFNGQPAQDTAQYSDVLPNFYTAQILQGTDVASASLEGLNSDELPVRTPNFNLTIESVPIPGPPGEVANQWVDPQGNTWRSDRTNQDLSFAYFIVEESEDYEENERGQKTRKMRVSFNCRLFNTTGESGVFNGSGVIAVAYPD